MIAKRQHAYARNFFSVTLVVCLSLYLSSSFAQARPSKEQYRKIFTEALNKFLTSPKKYNVCLPPMPWKTDGSESIDVNEAQMAQAAAFPTGLAAQMKALEDAGLVAGTTVDRTVVGNKLDLIRRFKRTEMGNTYFSRATGPTEVFINGQLCYARAELEKIVKWRGPATFGEYSVAWVYFTTRLADIADWVKTPAVLAAFPAARANLIAANPPSKDEPERRPRQAFIDLTSDGWEVNEWSRVLQ
jgi:hypothetical protein